jgi:hypothetical protein
MLPKADQAMQPAILACSQAAARCSFGRKPQPDDDRVAVTSEAVISGYGLGTLRDDHRAFMVTRFA